MSTIQDHHSGRSGLDDPRCAGRASENHGELRPNNEVLSGLQLRDSVRRSPLDTPNTEIDAIPCRIIEPLASRCSKFRFKPLDNFSTSTRLMQIASAENISLDPNVVDTLINTSQGDLRKSITFLQTASRLANSTDPPTAITPADIQEIAGVVPDVVVNDFATTLGIEISGQDSVMEVEGKVPTKAKGFEGIRRKVKEIVREGYSASQLLSQVRSAYLKSWVVR